MIASLSRRIRLAREAWAFILPLASITVLTASLGWRIPAGVGLVLIACVAFFFRDPERVIPQTPGAIVSPADGRVMEIVKSRRLSSNGFRILKTLRRFRRRNMSSERNMRLWLAACATRRALRNL